MFFPLYTTTVVRRFENLVEIERGDVFLRDKCGLMSIGYHRRSRAVKGLSKWTLGFDVKSMKHQGFYLADVSMLIQSPSYIVMCFLKEIRLFSLDSILLMSFYISFLREFSLLSFLKYDCCIYMYSPASIIWTYWFPGGNVLIANFPDYWNITFS